MGKIVWIPVHRHKAPAPAQAPDPSQAQDPSVKSKPKSYWGGYGHHWGGYGHHWYPGYGYWYPGFYNGLYTEQRYPYV